jgi:Family of unknown function (DUF5906)
MADPQPDDVPLDVNQFDLYACPDGFIFIPSGEIWSGTFVNKRLGQIGGVPASTWIAQHRAIEGLTWVPGEPRVMVGRLIVKAGWIEHPGARLFNLYTPPVINGGDAAQAGRWIDLVKFVYPDSWFHLINWFAHRTQFPGVKINHALVLGGSTRIGKDTILEPLRHAVGYPNTQATPPTALLGRFNGFFETVVLIVSEARDLGDINRYQLYDHLKQYIAAPPETILIDKKNISEYAILNRVGLVFTTNHEDGLYIPPDDARFHCNWSPRVKDDFTDEFWFEFHKWYAEGGIAHVASYLKTLDVSLFNPKSPPPHTEAFRAMVDAGRSSETSEFADLIEKLDRPHGVVITMLMYRADEDMRFWLKDRKNKKNIGRRLSDCGYKPFRNPDTDDGLWRVQDKRQVVYCRADISEREKFVAARRLTVTIVSDVSDYSSH